MGETVRVAVRARPLVPRELEEGSQTCLRFAPGQPQISLGGDKCFTFDYVFAPLCRQSTVYDQCVSPLLDSVFRGINATVLAYGQTGSGKTYTMGTFSAEMGDCEEEQLGIIPRVITDLFDGIAQRPQYESHVKVSFLEIYNELIRDLLNPHGSEPLGIREEPGRGIYIQGLTEQDVVSAQQISRCLAEGADSRVVGQTAMNERSSRSHAIFTVHLSMQHREVPEDALSAKFHLVDLAGSERAKKTQAEGERFREGININMGLSCLGNVISALCRHSSHIPYRDSKLTRLLQDSLGGNSRTLMIACVSPADTSFEETLNTLRYADRARQIKNKPVVNRDPQQAEILRLRETVRLLKSRLNQDEVAEIERQVSAETLLGGPDAASAGALPAALSSVGCSVCASGSVVSAAEYQKVCERCRQLSSENKDLTEQAGKAVDQATQLYMSMAVLEHVQDVMLSRLEKWKAQLASLSASCDQLPLKDVQRMVQTVLTAAAVTASGAAEATASCSSLGAAAIAASNGTIGLECDELSSGTNSDDLAAMRAAARAAIGAAVDSTDEDGDVDDQDDDDDDDEDDEEEEDIFDPLMQEKKTRFTQEMQRLKSQMSDTMNAIAKLSHNPRQDEARYEAQIKELEERINKLEAERTELLRQANDARQAEVRKAKLRELEAKLADARRELTDYNRMKREKEKRELEMGRLKDDMQKLKQTQVRLVKQMHADSMENRRRHMQKDAQLRQQQASLRRKDAETIRMRQQFEKQLAVAKRRGDEMSKHLRTQRQREQQLAVERLASNSANGASGSSSELVQGRLAALLADEMESAVAAADMRRHLELRMEERRKAASAGNQAAVDALNEQISQLQSMISSAPGPESTDQQRSRWAYGVKSLPEARLLLGEVFQRAVEARVAANAAEAGLKEIRDELEQTQAKVALLEKRKNRESFGLANLSAAADRQLNASLGGVGAGGSRQSKRRRESRLSCRVELLDTFQLMTDERLPSFDETPEDAAAAFEAAATVAAGTASTAAAAAATISDKPSTSKALKSSPPQRPHTPTTATAADDDGLNATLQALQASLHQSARRIRERGQSQFPHFQLQQQQPEASSRQRGSSGGGCKCRSDCSTARCGCRRGGSDCGQLCKCAIGQCVNASTAAPASNPGNETFSLDGDADDAGKENQTGAAVLKRPANAASDKLNATYDKLPDMETDDKQQQQQREEDLSSKRQKCGSIGDVRQF